MCIEAIESSLVRPVGQAAQAKGSNDPIMTAAATVAVFHQMQRAVGAALDIDQELIDILIRYGNNPDGIPALHYAIKLNDERAVQLLLDHGADVNAVASKISLQAGGVKHGFADVSALSFAAAMGNLSIMNMLIDRGAEVRFNYPNDPNWDSSPIFLAVICDRPEAVACLIARGALGNLHDPAELNLLVSHAINFGSVNVLKWFKGAGVDYKKRPFDHEDWLVGAVCSNQSAALKFLLDQGVDVNTRFTRHSGSTALHFAAAYKYLECVKVLIEHGADVNLIDKNGYSPLQSALCGSQQQVGMFQVIKALVDAGANINHKTQEGTPLIMGATGYFYNYPSNSDVHKEYKKCVEYLVSKGANINATNANGKNALYYARLNKNTDLIEWLIAHGGRD